MYLAFLPFLRYFSSLCDGGKSASEYNVLTSFAQVGFTVGRSVNLTWGSAARRIKANTLSAMLVRSRDSLHPHFSQASLQLSPHSLVDLFPICVKNPEDSRQSFPSNTSATPSSREGKGRTSNKTIGHGLISIRIPLSLPLVGSL